MTTDEGLLGRAGALAGSRDESGSVLDSLREVGRSLWRFSRRNPVAAISALWILLMVVCAVFAPLVAPYNPLQIAPADRLQYPSFAHPLGTDNLGRDVLSRIIYGARTSLYIGVLVVIIGTSIGTAIGVACGFFGGLVDTLGQRLVDAMQAVPGLVFALALISILGASRNNVVIAIAIFIIPGDARIMRSAVLRIRSQDFVQASRAVGCGNLRIMLRHVLPNVVGPLTIIASVAFGGAILSEAALSFLGLGVPPPAPSWGSMLTGAGRQFMEQRPTLAIFPGLAIILAVLSFNLLGDALRDVLDPKTRKL